MPSACSVCPALRALLTTALCIPAPLYYIGINDGASCSPLACCGRQRFGESDRAVEVSAEGGIKFGFKGGSEDAFNGKPRSDEGKEAWQKLENVYGSGRLHQFELKTPMAEVLQALSADRLLTMLLAPSEGEQCQVHELRVGVPCGGAEGDQLVVALGEPLA